MSSQTSCLRVQADHMQELERNFLPSLNQRVGGDGSAAASLPSLCQGRGICGPIAKRQHCKEVAAPLPILFFVEEGDGREMEHNPNSALSLSLPIFGCF